MAAGNVFSMVIDLPLSFFSDRLSHAAFYASGLFVLGSAFTAQILLGGTPALLVYVVTTAVADALISGADASLLVDVVGENRYRDTYRHLNRHFYLYTAAFFLAGVGLYYLDPRALMALQGLMLWSGATLVARIRPRASGTPRGSRPGRRSSPWATRGAGIRRYALGVPGDYIVIALVTVMLSAFFDGLMQFQNRTIQVIAADTASARFGGGIWTSAVLLALGNAASSVGQSLLPAVRRPLRGPRADPPAPLLRVRARRAGQRGPGPRSSWLHAALRGQGRLPASRLRAGRSTDP